MAATILSAPAGITGPAPAAGYRPATFANALVSEWTKIRTLRSTFFTLVATVVFVVGLGPSSPTNRRSISGLVTGPGTRPRPACRGS